MNNVYINTEEIASWVVNRYFKDKDIVSIDEILCTLEDAIDDLDNYKELYEDLQQDLYDNYKFVGQDYYEGQ